MNVRNSSSARFLGAGVAVLVAIIFAVLVVMFGNGSHRPDTTAGAPTAAPSASSTDGGSNDPNKPLIQGTFTIDANQACDWGIYLSKDAAEAGKLGNGSNDGAADINSRTCNGRPELHANLSRMAVVNGTPTPKECAQAVADQGKGMISYADIPDGYGVCVARSAGSYVSYLQPVRGGTWPSGNVTWKATVWSVTAQ